MLRVTQQIRAERGIPAILHDLFWGVPVDVLPCTLPCLSKQEVNMLQFNCIRGRVAPQEPLAGHSIVIKILRKASY